MSLAALRRASGLPLRHLQLLRAAASGLAQSMQSPCAIGGSTGGGCLPAAASSHLWRYDSPLLRHLNTAAAEPAANGPALPAYELVKQRAAASVDVQPLLELKGNQRTRFDALMRNFQNSGAVKDQALALYVNSKLYQQAVPEFKAFLVAAMDEELWRGLRQLQAGEGSQQALFPYFAQFVLERYMPEIKAYRDMVHTVDLRNPHQWFPVARALQRRIIYHAGPTNSGKTYNALQAMRAAKSGVYCGPLRLLAMEVYDTCNAEGLYCNLITGQERREVPGAEHTACTVEMVGMHKRVDVAVIDEIQMIGDEGRGWAWTRALMGVPANEVHICGDSSAVPLVRKICEEMGEQLEVNSYDRFTSLEVESGGLVGGYSAVQPGDCIVAFSRRDIYAIKQLIEQETKHRACVVYGALPPETRRQQARLFNEQDNAYRVMVASDAVGMGLNLNIRRVVFHSVTKHEGGNKRVPVSVSMLKQIAGRAGRRSSQWSQGLATCLNAGDVPRLQEAIDVPLDQLATPTAGLFPEFEHFEVFAGQRPDDPYSSLLEAFEREALLDSSYFFCKQDNVVQAAQLLGELGLSIKDMFSFCMAPASASDLRIGAALLNFATKFSKGLPVTLDISVPNRVPSSTDELRHMEAAHQVSMLWLWLSYRFDAEAFPNRDKVEAQAEFICGLLDKGLKRLTRLSKNGVDIAEKAARPEHQNVMACFSEELALLEERRTQQRTDERRQQTHEQRQQRAEERRQRALDSGGMFVSPGASSAAAAGAPPAPSSEVEAAEMAAEGERRRYADKAKGRKQGLPLQHEQQSEDRRQRRKLVKNLKLQKPRKLASQPQSTDQQSERRQALPGVHLPGTVMQQEVSGGSSTSGWGRLSSAFQ